MNIEYLKTLDENKTGNKLWKYGDPKGLTLQRIEEIEQQLNSGKPFPKAFREFLFLAGDISAIGIGPGYDIDYDLDNGEDYIQQMQVYEKLIQKEGLSIDRPYVIINCHDEDGFAFIYLDEGDDPRPRHYALDEKIVKMEGRIFPFPEKTFSELIDRLVDFALRGLQPF